MSYPTDRVVLFDRNMNPLPELTPHEVYSRVRTEEINGEHSLVITTTRLLQEGWHALTVDGTGKWREWVVTEIDESHESGKSALGTYHLVWSLQYDLTYSYFHDTEEGVSIGIGSDTISATAAEKVLENVPDWTVGLCDAPAIAAGTGCVFVRESAWSKLSKLVECSSCEVDSEIEVSPLHGVVSRGLCLREHLGNSEALRRFDWGSDLTGIKRTPAPGPYYCRVVPLGRGEQEYADDDETTYDYPLDITEETGTEENPGPYWIQDDEAAQAFRIRLSDNTYYYPTVAVTYGEDDPELLLNAAMKELHDYTRPGVTYEASVVQLAQAGMDVQGVALGDEVQVVDYGFNPDAALRIQGRVIKIEVDELSPETGTQLTIGQLRDSLADTIGGIRSSLKNLSTRTSHLAGTVASFSTERYLRSLIERLNEEINATGGYWYLVEGEGFITYDVRVADPLVGSEATKVVQIKGGSIRIADSKKTNFSGINDWNWKTVFTSGHVAADMVTAAQIVSGYIGSGESGNYWNLDTGEFRMAATSTLGGRTITQLLSDIDGVANDIDDLSTQEAIFNLLTNNGALQGLYMYNGQLYVNATYMISGFLGNDTNSSYFDLDNGILVMQQRGNNVRGKASYEEATFYPLSETTGLNTIGFYLQTTNLESGAYSNHKNAMMFFPNPKGHLDNSVIFVAGSLEIQAQQHTNYSDTAMNPSQGATKFIIGRGGVSLCYETLLSSSHNSQTFAVSQFGELSCKGFNLNGSTGVSGFDVYAPGDTMTLNATSSGKLEVTGATTITGDFIARGSIKSRAVDTNDYDTVLMHACETPTPMFADVGSATLDGRGECVVLIDDVFSEVARTDMAYQVFLQKCGEGDLWVSEKRSTCFVVNGTPGLAFDWEIKARQSGVEYLRNHTYETSDNRADELALILSQRLSIEGMYEQLLEESASASEVTLLAYGDPIGDLEKAHQSIA